MDRDSARKKIRKDWREIIVKHTRPAKRKVDGKETYICPFCGHGKGGDGIKDNPKSTNGEGIKCFTCGYAGDIIDFIQKVDNTDYNTALQTAAADLGITIDPYRPTAADDFRKAPREAIEKSEKAEKPTGDNMTAAADYQSYYRKCMDRIGETDYLEERGISKKTAARFMVGYDPSWRHPKVPEFISTTPRLIIPVTKSCYAARYTGDGRIYNSQGSDITQMTVGKKVIYIPHPAEWKNPDGVIFITEGEIDALSIFEVGGEAASIRSAGAWRSLIDYIEQNGKPQARLIIALDNDETGRGRTEDLTEELDRLEIPYTVGAGKKDEQAPNIYGNAKDANEALTKDRPALERAIAEAKARASEEARAEQEAEREEYNESSVFNHLETFRQNIKDSAKAAFFPTGFSELDRILDGGLYAGLYIVGAISSLGKTTFCLQICDQIAAAGHDVIVFSLEMAKDELMAKSISRLSYVEAMERHGISAAAKTTRGVLTGSRWESYNADELETLEAAMDDYSKYAGHIFIHEGVGNIGVDQVKEIIEKHIRVTGSRPVVLIDYLQILAPYYPEATDKRNTDKAVLELKRISRDCSIPIIGISSFNRENYTAPVNMASFKESGAVEYSSDVLMGMQYDGMDWQQGESEKERNKRIRALVDENIANGRAGKPQRLQLKVLKNRNGIKGNAYIDFISMFNYFVSHGQPLPGSGTPNPQQDPKKEEFHQMTADEWATFDEEDTPFEI